jgi:hypothetical protein
MVKAINNLNISMLNFDSVFIRYVIILIFVNIVYACNKTTQNPTTPPPPPTRVLFSAPPLNDLGTENFRGLMGGLYPGGKNIMAQTHMENGLAIAEKIRPLNGDGLNSPDGKVVWMAVGMSNTTQEAQQFIQLANALPGKNPALVLVDGAQGGFDIDMINQPTTPYWNTIDTRFVARGVNAKQVQVIWFKQADRQFPDTTMNGYINNFKVKLRASLVIMKNRYPNLKMVFLSGRIYGGYQTGTGSNPEPFAYYTSWGIKSLIEDQINGVPALRFQGADAPVPWIAWGPYIWANGSTPRQDGLKWIFPDDFQPDGIHPSNPIGSRKVGQMLIEFFRKDTCTKSWFMQ